MRKPLLILLLTIHFLGNTEINLLFKLPQLVSHYFQHCRQDPDLSFFTFLNMHYGGDDGTSTDDQEDNKLPYHNHLQSHSFNFVISSLSKSDIAGIDADESMNEYNSQLSAARYLPGYVQLILQPPRFT